MAVTSLVGQWMCTRCGEFCDEGQLRRDGCCPTCGGEVEMIKPPMVQQLTGIEREFGGGK